MKKVCNYKECKRKLKLFNTFTCRCNGEYCATHRHSFDHECTFDHIEHNKEILSKNLVKLDKIKIDKI